MTDLVSALYVRADGPYPGLVADWWDETRDARLYAGPNPVVAHPPCARWGRFALRWHGTYGGDGGCFEAALAAVRRFGGVLEHPRESHAWKVFGLMRPTYGVVSRSLLRPDEWVFEVDQRDWGHRAQKPTWLLYVGPEPPRLFIPTGRHASPTTCERLSHRQRELTPLPFAELLVRLAESAFGGRNEVVRAWCAQPCAEPSPTRTAASMVRREG